MSLIEGIGDEVTQFFLLVFAAAVAYIAWWSTNISEQRQFRTVLLLDRRRHSTRSILRVRIPSRQLTNHTETVTISEGTSSNSTTSVQTEASSDSTVLTETDSVPQTSSSEPKSDIVTTPSAVSQNPVEGVTAESAEEREESENLLDLDENDIIETMDADTQNELRQRRLAHFEGASGNTNATNTQQSDVSEVVQSAHLPTVDNLGSNVQNEEPKVDTKQQIEMSNAENTIADDIVIKLKYINDDVRVVGGRLEELLGDFKRRHFLEELNANKVIKLIFNGQVLKQDRNTLQRCGLFNNCVVHCLIHQKRPSLNDRDRPQDNINETDQQQFLRDSPFVHVTNVNNNNQGIDWDLGSFLFALVSFILAAAWYFRYSYGHLYTGTATVGLIIITIVFLVVLLGAYFPDNQIPDANLRIRVTRTERVEVQ